jgi:hypothetical protein
MIPLVYIAAPSYSGSTLLTFLLNAHPDVGTIGELKWGNIDLATYTCSCGALLRECGFWRRVTRAVTARGLPFSLQRPATDFRCRTHRLTDRVARARVRGRLFESVRSGLLATLPESRREWPLATMVNRALIETVLDLQQAVVFVDASKDPVRLKHLLDTGEYDVRAIQLVRDGRGVTNSGVTNKGAGAAAAAREWLRTHRQIERLAPQLGRGRLRRVRYEDLCRDPAGTVDGIFRFIGLDPATAARDFRAVEHHILGNAMRLRASSAVAPDEKWRTMLGDARLAEFERVAGELNRTYGYT